jgi:4-hydroxybenzoate polyprenyltransferase
LKAYNQQKLKVFALLSSIRWYNIVLIAIAQYLSALFVFNSFPSSLLLVAFDLKLHLLVACSLLVVAAGFLINDFYDFQHDMIVRPKTTLIKHFIDKDFRIKLYVWLNLIAFFLAWIGSWEILIFYVVLAFSLWFYSHKLKKIPFIKEVSSSLLTVSCFFSVGLHYFQIETEVIAFGLYFLMLLFTRTFIKGYEEIKGDIATNAQTLPGYLGDKKIRMAIRLVIAIQLLYSLFLAYIYYPSAWLYYLFFSGIILVVIVIGLGQIRQGEFYILSFVYKVLVLLGILNLLFF